MSYALDTGGTRPAGFADLEKDMIEARKAVNDAYGRLGDFRRYADERADALDDIETAMRRLEGLTRRIQIRARRIRRAL